MIVSIAIEVYQLWRSPTPVPRRPRPLESSRQWLRIPVCIGSYTNDALQSLMLVIQSRLSVVWYLLYVNWTRARASTTRPSMAFPLAPFRGNSPGGSNGATSFLNLSRPSPISTAPTLLLPGSGKAMPLYRLQILKVLPPSPFLNHKTWAMPFFRLAIWRHVSNFNVLVVIPLMLDKLLILPAWCWSRVVSCYGLDTYEFARFECWFKKAMNIIWTFFNSKLKTQNFKTILVPLLKRKERYAVSSP